MIKIGFKKVFFSIIYIGTFSNIFNTTNYLQANQINNFTLEKENLKTENISKNIKSEYILGPRDEINITFRGLNDFSGIYIIDRDGYISLPELGSVKAEGKTIKELKSFIIERYKNYIYEPDISLSLIFYKPIKVIIKGEVARPGLYTFDISNKKRNKDKIDPLNSKYLDTINSNSTYFYNQARLFDIFKESNGITNQADISNIKIIRINSKSQGGGKIATHINLIDLLEKGDMNQNLELHNGDLIIVPKSDKPIIKQILSINKSNLTPDTISIYVNGNILRPGKVTLPQGSSLFEALAASGGNKPQTGQIEFIRFNENGKTTKKTFAYKPTSQKNSPTNPLLIDGDIIIVRANILGKTTSVIREFGTPLINAVGIYKIFD